MNRAFVGSWAARERRQAHRDGSTGSPQAFRRAHRGRVDGITPALRSDAGRRTSASLSSHSLGTRETKDEKMVFYSSYGFYALIAAGIGRLVGWDPTGILAVEAHEGHLRSRKRLLAVRTWAFQFGRGTPTLRRRRIAAVSASGLGGLSRGAAVSKRDRRASLCSSSQWIVGSETVQEKMVFYSSYVVLVGLMKWGFADWLAG